MKSWVEWLTIAFLLLQTLLFALWVWLAVNDEADAISALPLAVPVLCLLAAPALAVGLLLAKRSAAAGTDQPSA